MCPRCIFMSFTFFICTTMYFLRSACWNMTFLSLVFKRGPLFVFSLVFAHHKSLRKHTACYWTRRSAGWRKREARAHLVSCWYDWCVLIFILCCVSVNQEYTDILYICVYIYIKKAKQFCFHFKPITCLHKLYFMMTLLVEML